MRVCVSIGSQCVRTGSQFTREKWNCARDFSRQITTCFDADENEFREAGNVKRIETSAQITSMKSKSSAAEAIGRKKKKKKGGKNRKKREKMKIEHRKRQKSAVVVHGSFDISSLRS